MERRKRTIVVFGVLYVIYASIALLISALADIYVSMAVTLGIPAILMILIFRIERKLEKARDGQKVRKNN